MFEHALDEAHELVLLEGLLDEIHGPLLHGVDCHRNVAMAGDEDDGQGRVVFDEPVLQLQAGHSPHADIDDQAGHLAGIVPAEEGLGRVETAHAVVLAFEQPLQ